MIQILLSILLLSAPARAGTFTAQEIRDWADYLFTTADIPDELKDPQLSGVTRDFGPSKVPLAQLPFDSPMALASSTPWSSWWFPQIERDLFDDGLGTAALEKYDLVRAAKNGRSGAAAFEAKSYRPTGPHWEGLCDAWAIAASIFPEPKAARSVKLSNGSLVSFSVGDQKALLLKTLDAVDPASLTRYGQRFTGNADGWIFPDLFPQELHRFVEKQLFERKQMFIMDHDPGVEVWSEPVYKANYRVSAVPGRPDAVFVRLWLYSATTYPSKEQRDKIGLRELVREYDYYLFGKPDGAGNLVVESGVWAKGELVDSRRDHPDFVYFVKDPASLARLSRNPEIDPAIVDQILGH